MVRFLLENSLGAWWAARHPDSPLIKDFEYLRFDDDGQPGCRVVRRLARPRRRSHGHGPCCGSGHFLVEAFSMLWRMRAEEEELSAGRGPGRGPAGQPLRPRARPPLRADRDVRCGAPGMEGGRRLAPASRPQHRLLRNPSQGARSRSGRRSLTGTSGSRTRSLRLHILFSDADTLGSLIDPQRAADLTSETGPQRLLKGSTGGDHSAYGDCSRTRNNEPHGISHGRKCWRRTAAVLLSRTYVLSVTNVPFLSRMKQMRSFGNI